MATTPDLATTPKNVDESNIDATRNVEKPENNVENNNAISAISVPSSPVADVQTPTELETKTKRDIFNPADNGAQSVAPEIDWTTFINATQQDDIETLKGLLKNVVASATAATEPKRDDPTSADNAAQSVTPEKNWTDFIEAIKEDDIEQVRKLIKLVNINVKVNSPRNYIHAYLPIHVAAFYHSHRSLQLLLEHGANVNAQVIPFHRVEYQFVHQENATPLLLALSPKILRGRNLQPNDDKDTEYRPLKFLSGPERYRFDETIRVLLNANPDVNVTSKFGSPALHAAVGIGSSYVTSLIEHKADVENRLTSYDNKNLGDTPLIQAINSSNLQTVIDLVNGNANINTSVKGWVDGTETLLHHTVRVLHHQNIYNMFSVDAQSQYDIYGADIILAYLIMMGADLNALNAPEKSHFGWSVKNGSGAFNGLTEQEKAEKFAADPPPPRETPLQFAVSLGQTNKAFIIRIIPILAEDLLVGELTGTSLQSAVEVEYEARKVERKRREEDQKSKNEHNYYSVDIRKSDIERDVKDMFNKLAPSFEKLISDPKNRKPVLGMNATTEIRLKNKAEKGNPEAAVISSHILRELAEIATDKVDNSTADTKAANEEASQVSPKALVFQPQSKSEESDMKANQEEDMKEKSDNRQEQNTRITEAQDKIQEKVEVSKTFDLEAIGDLYTKAKGVSNTFASIETSLDSTLHWGYQRFQNTSSASSTVRNTSDSINHSTTTNNSVNNNNAEAEEYVLVEEEVVINSTDPATTHGIN